MKVYHLEIKSLIIILLDRAFRLQSRLAKVEMH